MLLVKLNFDVTLGQEMLHLFALLGAASVTGSAPTEIIYVPQQTLNCYVRKNAKRRLNRPPRNLYYLDLRSCSSVGVKPAVTKLGAFPSFRRATPPPNLYPDARYKRTDGSRVDLVVVVSGAELNCLHDPDRRRRILSKASNYRYGLVFRQCK